MTAYNPYRSEIPLNFMRVKSAIRIIEDIIKVNSTHGYKVQYIQQQLLSGYYTLFMFKGHAGNVYTQDLYTLVQMYEKLKYTKEVFVYDIPGFEFTGV